MIGPDTPAAIPHLFLLLYDRLSRDDLGFLGGERPTVTFDYLGLRSLTVERTSHHSPQADIALGTLLTGILPDTSGVHNMEVGEPQTGRRGYKRREIPDLFGAAFSRSRQGVAFNCGELSTRLPFVAWRNRAPGRPHLDQIRDFLRECQGGPSLVVDRFDCSPGVSSSERMATEDRRLYHLIDLLTREGILASSAIILAGLPGANGPDDSPTIVFTPGGSGARRPFARHIDVGATAFALIGCAGKFDGRNLLVDDVSETSSLFFGDEVIELRSGTNLVERLPLANDPGQRSSTEQCPQLAKRYPVVPRRLPDMADPLTIRKSALFIVGAGRSGNMFFSQLLQRPEFPNITCEGLNWPFETYEISVLRDEGLIDDVTARRRLSDLYRPIIERPHEVFGAVSHNLWGVLEDVARLFPNGLFVVLARDPRTLLSSAVNFPSVTQLRDFKAEESGRSIDYPSMARAGEGEGWVANGSARWVHYMKRYLDFADRYPDRTLVVRFEDIFKGERTAWRPLADHVAPLFTLPTDESWVAGITKEKVNAHPDTYPRWREWSAADRIALLDRCAPLMRRLGYDPEAQV